jgi:hypothetical protein
VIVEFAEAAAEGYVLFARDLLVAEQQDALLEKGPVDLVEIGIAERLGEIHSLNLGTESMGERPGRKGHGRNPYQQWILSDAAPRPMRRQEIRPRCAERASQTRYTAFA